MQGLEIRSLWMHFGARTVLENLNLSVSAGAFCAVVGASGCGKTTLLRLLLGTEQPTRGSVRLDGKPLPPEPGPQRGIVFQRYAVYPHLSVLGNVVLALELRQARWTGRLWGARRRSARVQAVRMLDAVGLAHAQHQYPHTLSGGMCQRLSLAQALINAPRLLLLDEPFGALDPGSRADMQALVRGLWQSLGLTVFMVTHDLSEAFALATRVLVLDKPRRDPQAPDAYGARITYDIPVRRAAVAGAGEVMPAATTGLSA